MKRIFPLILPIIALLIVSCSSDDTLEVEALDETSQFTPVGDPVEVTLNLSTLPFTVDEETRAEEPDSYTPNSDNTDEQNILMWEKWIRNLWVFEYDKETGKLIGFPQYISSNSNISESTLDVKLSDNNGNPVIIYVVAHADAGTNGSTVSGNITNYSENWVTYDKTTGKYDGFMTIEDLEANILPTQYVAEAEGGNATWPPHYMRTSAGSTTYGQVYYHIPKSGSVEIDKVYEGVKIQVPLTNMYAKLMLYVDFSDCDLSDNTLTGTSGKEINYRFAIDNIPNYCTVGALGKADTTTRGNYPSTVVWGCYGYPYYSSHNTTIGFYYEELTWPYLLETIYVPENIQGDNSSYDRTLGTYPPAGTGKITSGVTLNDGTFSTTYSSISVYEKTDALAIYYAWGWSGSHNLGWYGPVFPGGNETTNFNMRRNCTYRVILHIKGNGE